MKNYKCIYHERELLEVGVIDDSMLNVTLMFNNEGAKIENIEKGIIKVSRSYNLYYYYIYHSNKTYKEIIDYIEQLHNKDGE